MDVPVYDFTTHQRSKETRRVPPADVVRARAGGVLLGPRVGCRACCHQGRAAAVRVYSRAMRRHTSCLANVFPAFFVPLLTSSASR